MSEIVSAVEGKIEHELDGLKVEVVWSAAPTGAQSLLPAVAFRRTPASLRVALVDPLAHRTPEGSEGVDSLALWERDLARAELVGAAAYSLTLDASVGTTLRWLEQRWASPHWRGPAAAIIVADVGVSGICSWRAGDGNGHVKTESGSAVPLFSDRVLRDVPATQASGGGRGSGDRGLPADPSSWLSAPLGSPGAAVESRETVGTWQELVLRTGCAPREATGSLRVGECTHLLPHVTAATVTVRAVKNS